MTSLKVKQNFSSQKISERFSELFANLLSSVEHCSHWYYQCTYQRNAEEGMTYMFVALVCGPMEHVPLLIAKYLEHSCLDLNLRKKLLKKWNCLLLHVQKKIFSMLEKIPSSNDVVSFEHWQIMALFWLDLRSTPYQ